MNRKSLAAKLVASANARERTRLLGKHRSLADVALAEAIKDICYSTWATEPARARNAASALASLSKSVPTEPRIEVLATWVGGIAEITRGRLEAAIEKLELASAGFKNIRDVSASASPLVAMLIPLAMLGRYDEALAVGKKALRIFDREGDQLAAGKVEMNLSNILSRRGRLRASEKLGLAALARFEQIGETTWRTMAENDLANTYTELNDFRRAEMFYARALEGARVASMRVTEAEIEASMGNLARFRGRFAEALRFLELSRAKYDDLQMPHQSAVAELEIAGIYAELNLTAESLEIYRRVAPKLTKLKMRGEEARARAELGRASNDAGDPKTARRELKRAAKLFASEKNRVARASAVLMLATVELGCGRLVAASDALRAARQDLRASGDVRQELAADLLAAELEIARGATRAAERRLAALVPTARRFEQSSVEQNALVMLGRIAAARGDVLTAEENLRKAIALVEKIRQPLPAEEFRIAFFSARVQPYEDLAKLLLAGGRISEAFECFEHARSRALVEAMVEVPQGADQNGLSEKITAVREELNWFYSRAARVDGPESPQREIAKREKELTQLIRRAGSTRAGRATAETKGVVGVAELQRELGRNSALLEYVQIGDQLSVFVVTDRGVEFVRDVAARSEIEPLLAGLRFQFDSLRYQPESIARFERLLKAKTDRYLESLGDKLIEPVRELIGGRDLIISPVSLLHYLPFHAFRSGGRYIVEERSVSYAPSASVWQRLRPARLGVRPAALLIGFADENIPHAGGEVESLRRLFRPANALTGGDATFAAYQTLAPECDVLHFACHGQFRPDDPSYSSLHLADGWVTVKDICEQQLKAQVVTLSACETGLNEIAGGEEVIGLARGFLSAGAASIVLSLWTVNDAAAARLTEDFYVSLQRGATVAASLRIAQTKLIDEGRHPYFWSPFLAIGK